MCEHAPPRVRTCASAPAPQERTSHKGGPGPTCGAAHGGRRIRSRSLAHAGMILHEYLYGKVQPQAIWDTASGTPSLQRQPVVRSPAAAKASRYASQTLLPKGYPSSVTPDYLSFQVWDSLQALCSYVRGSIVTKALLVAIGVGEANATALGATYQYFVKDFTSMMLGIVLASHQVGACAASLRPFGRDRTKPPNGWCLQGSRFDSQAKQWRLTADVVNDVGMTLELACGVFPRYFYLPLAVLASCCRSVTSLAADSTRVTLTQHFAISDNAGDISAKERTQETMVNLVGMISGVLLIRVVNESQLYTWAWYVFFTAVHVVANYKAMRCLHLKSLNGDRLEVLFNEYYHHNRTLTPAQVAALEPLFTKLPPWTAFLSIARSLVDLCCSLLGVQWNRAWRVSMGNPIRTPLNFPSSKRHPLSMASLASFHAKHRYSIVGDERTRVLHVLLSPTATKATELDAYVHALYYQATLPAVAYGDTAAHQQARTWMQINAPFFRESLQSSGWDTNKILLGKGDVRMEWQAEDRKKA
eukprot:scaffold1851_cov390-Prasinococcus_capsulatus_cf.AAC.4